MARIRTIKPEFFTSSDIVAMTPLARLFYVSLWCEADREGRLKWEEMTLKIRYFPTDNCDISKLKNELISKNLIVIYEIDGKKYAEIPSFKTHQVINNREADSVLPPRKVGASDTRESGGSGEGRKEGKGKEHASNTKFKKPTLQEVKDYCNERGNDVDPKQFLDHYETTGWMRGKTKIKDWKACVRTWESNSKGNGIQETYGAGGI